MPNLGDVMPDFTADSTAGTINFHEWLDGSWAIFFSHPADFTPVCTTELSKAQNLMPEFRKRGVKVIALSVDTVENHHAWIEDMKKKYTEDSFDFPILSDPKREIAVKLGMIDPDEKDAEGCPVTARAVFVICPQKKMKLSILYPATTGRNFDEILRVIDSLQLTATKKVATPVNWVDGGEAMVLPTVSAEDLPTVFPGGVRVEDVPSGKEYMRFTTDYK